MPQRVLDEAEYNAIRDHVLKSAPDGLDEAGFQRYIGPVLAQAVGEAESLPRPAEGSAIGRFVSNAWEMVNPVSLVSNIGTAIAHPVDTLTNIAGAQVQQGKQAIDLAKEGRLMEAAGHGAAAALPLVGPASARAGEQIASGDVAGGLGKAVGLEAPFALGAVARFKTAPNPRAAEMLTRQAEEQVAGKVLAPGNPAYKGRAAAIAPDMLARKLTGGREELQQAAEEGMAEAGSRLDDAIQSAGGVKAPIPAAEVIAGLNKRVADLQDSSGVALSTAAAKRINALQQRIIQVKALAGKSGTVMFEDLWKIRDENYRLADESRGYERQGNPAMADEGWAARETGSTIRDVFAKRSPASAEANADFTFWKSLNDVLDPVLGRPKSTAPSAGVTGGARTIGAVIGNMMGPKAAFVLSSVVPWVKERLASPAWQLTDAQSKMQLAEAMRRGDIGRMKSLMIKISKATPLNATSPSGSQSQTTIPASSAP